MLWVDDVRIETGRRSGVALDRLNRSIWALRTGRRVHVVTASRDVEGHVYEVGRSPFHNDFNVRVVDDSGKVHYFRPLRDDCTVELL